MHALPATSRKINVANTYFFIAPYSLIHNFVRGQQLRRIPLATVVQRANIIVHVDAAADLITILLGLVGGGHVLASQNRAKQVCAVARAAGEGNLAADQNEAIPVQSAV